VPHQKFPLPLRRFICTSLAAASLFGTGRAAAAAPADYLVDAWDTENNLPSRTVTAIAQTPDGYLWAGTYNGLARFDGARFVTFDPASTPELTRRGWRDFFWTQTARCGSARFAAD